MNRAKDYLRQIALLNAKIQSRLDELQDIRDRALGLKAITYDRDPVQTSGAGDSMADAVARYIDKTKEIQEMTDELVARKHKIVGEIEQLSDPRHVRLLNLRYVSGLTFEAIADEMGYDVRWIYSIHGSALQEFERLHFNSG